jgi:YbbR domain-containing protein
MKKFVLFFAFFTAINLSSFGKNEPVEQIKEIDNSIIIDRISNDDVDILIPNIIFSFSDADIKIRFHNPEHTKLLLNNNKVEFLVNGNPEVLNFVNGEASFKHRFDGSNRISVYVEDLSFNRNVTVYPLWAFLVPLCVIVLYILKRLITKK